MIPLFDLFRFEDGHLIWFGVASNLENAKEKVRAAIESNGRHWSSRYVIFSQITGERIVIDVDGDDGDSSSNKSPPSVPITIA